MKTAMQEMLEWTRSTFPMDLDTPRMIEDKIESLIEKEKEEIIMAVTYGNSIKPFDGTEAELGLQYYEERYKQNK
jgi:hypothetical protein